jgi:predicted metal-dependent enzyme (double-stranded beta helix superfamily)
VAAPGIPELRRPRERTWVLLAATDLFEAWAIGWPPGGQIELHDHGTSSGAVAVAAGALTETTVHPTDGGTTLVARRRLCAGELRRFGPGHIHDLINEDGDPAVSVHVYGPRLEAMSFYRVTGGGRLEVVRTDQVTPVGPFDTAGAHDPG